MSIQARALFSGGEAGERACPDRKVADMASGPTFLTVAEVAGQLRVSKMTVYRLVHSGELEAVRVGRSFRLTEEAVQTFLEKSYFEAG